MATGNCKAGARYPPLTIAIRWTDQKYKLQFVMKIRSKATRRRFLFNTAMLAAGWELSGADEVLTQELMATPDCHDGDEPTVSETEGQSQGAEQICPLEGSWLRHSRSAWQFAVDVQGKPVIPSFG